MLRYSPDNVIERENHKITSNNYGKTEVKTKPHWLLECLAPWHVSRVQLIHTYIHIYILENVMSIPSVNMLNNRQSLTYRYYFLFYVVLNT